MKRIKKTRESKRNYYYENEAKRDTKENMAISIGGGYREGASLIRESATVYLPEATASIPIILSIQHPMRGISQTRSPNHFRAKPILEPLKKNREANKINSSSGPSRGDPFSIDQRD